MNGDPDGGAETAATYNFSLSDSSDGQGRNAPAIGQSSPDVAKLLRHRAKDVVATDRDRSPTSDSAWDEIAESFNDGEVDFAMRASIDRLAALRSTAGREGLAQLEHSEAFLRLRAIIHEGPFARRGFVKPRGHPGDAVLLDYIYGLAPLPDDISARGEAIYDWCQQHSIAFRSVKFRRNFFAAEIDRVSREHVPGAIVSVACGHLREAALSSAVLAGDAPQCYAIDQDSKALKLVASTYGRGIDTVNLSVGGILKGRFKPGPCTLVYAAGLFDYLADDVAASLLPVLERLLAPGGKLIVPHFTSMRESGYIEALLHWYLIYRNEEALRYIANGCTGTRSFWADPEGSVTYLVVERT